MKQVIILLCIAINHFTSWGQDGMTTDGPCTEAQLLKLKGKWMKDPILTTIPSKADQQEAYKRLDEIHNMFLKLYPQPMGMDVLWHHTIGPGYFGAQRKYYKNRDSVLTFDYVKLPHVSAYYYNSNFHPYYCTNNKVSKPTGDYTNYASQASIHVFANSIQGCIGELNPDDTWTINGLPVRMRNPVLTENWKGFVMQHPESGGDARYILIHRNGKLPYIPVTRKQYLDYCLSYHSKIWDQQIDAIKQLPVRTLDEQEAEKKAKLDKFQKDFGNDPKKVKSAVDYYLSGYQTDQQRRDEQVSKIITIKKDFLKHFTDELEKTTKEGLLDSPAIVLIKYHHNPIFDTNPEKGSMLVTENPDYIRKDLPNYVPQIFVLTWNDNSPQKNITKFIEQNFPIEKLQAMIDK